MSEDRFQEDRRHWRHERRASGIFWGMVLILLGIVFFLSAQGWLPWGDWWQYFLIGLGLIFLAESLMRYSGNTSMRPRFGRVIAGLVLILIGLVFLMGIGNWWPLILIVVGLAIMVNVWLRKT